MFKQLRKDIKSKINPSSPRLRQDAGPPGYYDNINDNIFADVFKEDSLSEIESFERELDDPGWNSKQPGSPKIKPTNNIQTPKPSTPRITIPKMSKTTSIVKPITPKTTMVKTIVVKPSVPKPSTPKPSTPKPSMPKPSTPKIKPMTPNEISPIEIPIDSKSNPHGLTTIDEVSIEFPDLLPVSDNAESKSKKRRAKITVSKNLDEASIAASTIDMGYIEVTDDLTILRLRDQIKYINATGELKYGVVDDKSYDATTKEYTFRLRASSGGGYCWSISSLRVKRFWRLLKQDQSMQTTVNNIVRFLDMKYNGEFSVFNEDADRYLLVLSKVLKKNEN